MYVQVCVSLLGTWSGRGVEVWGKDSSLLQVIVSLQGLILNAEPYFNEAGYEKQKGRSILVLLVVNFTLNELSKLSFKKCSITFPRVSTF